MIANPSLSPEAPADEPKERTGTARSAGGLKHYLRFVLVLVLATLAFRSLVLTPFTIPSESMLPTLIKGDYLLAAKWPYGWSRWSLPFDAPLIGGTVAPKLPARGDVAIFRHPVDRSEYIKRVIGLPGDMVAMRGGQIVLNGEPVPKRRVSDFRLPVSPNTGCAWAAVKDLGEDGQTLCRYARFEETLPGGRSYFVLDFGTMRQDDYGPITVPAGHVFVMGDNRDNSQDSRFPPRPGGGVGLVPAALLVARAERVVFSTDGSARWYDPISWLTALRWHRMGEQL